MLDSRQRYLRVGDVAARYAIGITTVWERVAAGNMPAPVRLGPRTTRWALSDLEEWEGSFRKIT